MQTTPSQPLFPPVEPENTTCPLLGLYEDKATRFLFASTGNYCHALKGPQQVDFSHQSSHCLTTRHVQCPVFLGPVGRVFPDELKPADSQGRRAWDWRVAAAGLGVVLICAALAAFWYVPGLRALWEPSVSGAVLAAPATVTALPAVASPTEMAVSPFLVFSPTSPSPQPEGMPSATPRPTDPPTPTVSPTPTATPPPSPTPFPTPGPGFETPFGQPVQFLIHVVKAGQSYASLARAFDTTPEVLAAINVTVQGASLWEGQQIVVAVGVKDPAGLPKFVVHYVTQETSLEALAAEFDASQDQIRLYNQLGAGSRIPSGRWLIVPKR